MSELYDLLIHNIDALDAITKEAFIPMPGGQPPAPPPMDPAAAGMDPAMAAAGGGMPPMDPAMAGGGGMPIDPSMMAAAGGMQPNGPPPPPAEGAPPAPPPNFDPMTFDLVVQALRQVIQEVGIGEGKSEDESDDKPKEKSDSTSDRLARIEEALGISGQDSEGGDEGAVPSTGFGVGAGVPAGDIAPNQLAGLPAGPMDPGGADAMMAIGAMGPRGGSMGGLPQMTPQASVTVPDGGALASAIMRLRR